MGVGGSAGGWWGNLINGVSENARALAPSRCQDARVLTNAHENVHALEMQRMVLEVSECCSVGMQPSCVKRSDEVFEGYKNPNLLSRPVNNRLRGTQNVRR
jgi:hypothetical protein